jgi:mannose-1-phosphate guanylyltransferase
MEAFLLAAGLGTRLRPLTETVPKCLVPIAGRPLLHYWFVLLAHHGITEVLLNLHHLPDLVRDYLDREPPPVEVTTSYEEELLESAGTVRANADCMGDDHTFLVAYADNFTDADLIAMITSQRRHDPPLVLGLFRTDRPTECGIATMDAHGMVVAFEERPTAPSPTSLTLASMSRGAIYSMRSPGACP